MENQKSLILEIELLQQHTSFSGQGEKIKGRAPCGVGASVRDCDVCVSMGELGLVSCGQVRVDLPGGTPFSVETC